MKILSIIAILFLVILLSSETKAGILESPITVRLNSQPSGSFDVDKKRISGIRNLMEHYYKTPISLELKTSDKEVNLSITNQGEILSAFLDRLVQADPRYKWESIRDSICVFPKDGAHTDALIDCTFENVTTEEAFQELARRITELGKVPPTRAAATIRNKKVQELYQGVKFTVNVGKVSIRESLCAINERSPLYIHWTYIPGRDGVTITDGTTTSPEPNVIFLQFYNADGTYAGME